MERIGKYRVLGHLASGGMGQVYLAQSTGLGGFERTVVVKTLETESSEQDLLVAMFLDEARVLGALHHQFISPIYEVGCDEEGRYFLVMDYVRGETAEAVWRTASDRNLPLPLSFSLSVVTAIASALDYAHTLVAADGTPLAIVHRDVSLSNVMVGYEGAVKLIDFGIAKFKTRTASTQVGSLKGKLGYLAPEQVLHKAIDHRADVFALGVVLYELTTMQRAFVGNSELITLENITRGEFVRPSEVVAGYPPELEEIVMRALAVDPDQRFATAGEMEQAVEAVAAARQIALGHRAIAEVMAGKVGDGRRRFARSSAEITKPPTPEAVDLVPVEDTEPTSRFDDLGKSPAGGIPDSAAPNGPSAPLRRAATQTAQIVRPEARSTVPAGAPAGLTQTAPSPFGLYYLLAAVFAVGLALAGALAYR